MCGSNISSEERIAIFAAIRWRPTTLSIGFKPGAS